ncbi:MAG TPA: hypothetical protein VIY28_01265 [Pseudonocardiaceae bacterium]
MREGQLQRRDLHKREDRWYFGVYYREADQVKGNLKQAGEKIKDVFQS